MKDNRKWLLITRKLTKEASIEELEELEALLCTDPDLGLTLEMLKQVWIAGTSEPTAVMENEMLWQSIKELKRFREIQQNN